MVVIEARMFGIARILFDFRENNFQKSLEMQGKLIMSFASKYGGYPVETLNIENLPVYTWAFDAGNVSLSILTRRVIIVFTSEADEARIFKERVMLAADHAKKLEGHRANRAAPGSRVKHFVVYWVLVPLALLVIVQFLLVFIGLGP